MFGVVHDQLSTEGLPMPLNGPLASMLRTVASFDRTLVVVEPRAVVTRHFAALIVRQHLVAPAPVASKDLALVDESALTPLTRQLQRALLVYRDISVAAVVLQRDTAADG